MGRAVSSRNFAKDSKIFLLGGAHGPAALLRSQGSKKNYSSGTQCMTTPVRDIALGLCVLGVIGTAGSWVTNLVLRKNKDFQQASGVLEGADIASNLFGSNN